MRESVISLGRSGWSWRFALMAVAVTAAAWSAFAAPAIGEGLGSQTVVLANRNVPESVELAKYYMQRRGIPGTHLCLVDVPSGETVAREIFELQLRDPLLEFLRRQKLIDQVRRNPAEVGPNETSWNTLSTSIRYVVSMYGIPVKIADTRFQVLRILQDQFRRINLKDAAAVDSELALLLHPGYGLAGPIANPLFNQVQWDDAGSASSWLLIAARLDGPDPATVRRMIDDAIWAERYGLQGRVYIDARGIQHGAYQAGDHWLRESAERFLREGYEVVLDQADFIWGDAYPVEQAAVYMGWYAENVSGPFTRSDFRFQRGAIAYHIHSGSASILRSTDQRWTGPLLAKGAAVSMGAVTEPFLNYTPQLDLMADRLCEGHTFGESVYMAQPVLSWQMTFVGDPLYTPFKASLEDQIAALEKDGLREVEWAYLREINLLVRDGRFNYALEYCRSKLREHESLVLREKLGDLYAKNDLVNEAGEQYEVVIEKSETAAAALRVGARWMLILRLLGRKDEAALVESRLRERWKGSPQLAWLEMAQP